MHSPTGRGLRTPRPASSTRSPRSASSKRCAERAITRLAQKWQEFTAKAEYAYDYGMPQRMAQVDRFLGPLQLERLFLGRHKFYHFRIWYKRKLREFLESAGGADCPPCYREGIGRRMIEDHLAGSKNHTSELHRLLTARLTGQNIASKKWAA